MLLYLQAFRLVERGSFRRLLKFCRPSLSERDIPGRLSLRAEILRRAHIAEGRVRDNMGRIPSKISFTFDAWTSKAGDPYMSLTAHYIDAPIDRPNVWVLRSEQLLFQEIQGRHTGKNMGEILSRAVDRYELRGKVCSFFISITELLLFHSTGWMVYERRCSCESHHSSGAPGQPVNGYWMDGART
jgi:hypothetical protein